MTVVAFDLDDTLYKEVDYLRSGVRAIATELSQSHQIAYAETVATLGDGPSIQEGLDLLAARHGLRVADLLQIYRNHTPDITLPDESRELLDYLKLNHYSLALITDGRSKAQRAKISALGLLNYFPEDLIIISGEIGADKHQPDGFQRVMAGHPDSEYVYIGDNPRKDFYWPNRFGWQTIQLLDPKRLNIKPPIIADTAHAARFTIETLTQLPAILRPT